MAVTARMGLYRPTNSDIVDVNAALTDQLQYFDTGAVVQSCTFATRPTGATLYTGKLIYETDTENLLKYSGSVWEIIQSRTFPRGRVAYTSTVTDSTTIGNNTQTMLLTVTFTAATNRVYAINCGGEVEGSAGTDAPNFTRVFYAAGAVVNFSSTEVSCRGADCNDNAISGANMAWWHKTSHIPSINGQVTYGIAFGRPAAVDGKSARSVGYQWIGVEDIGSL